MYLKKVEERTQKIFKLGRDQGPLLFAEFPPVKSREKIVPLIDSIVNDRNDRFVLDVRNDGAIRNLPDDVAVEIPARADSRGIHQDKFGSLTDAVVKMVLVPRLARLEIALEAFLSGDRSLLLELLYRDPRTRSDEQAREVLDEILALPFNEGMRNHYK